MKLAAKLVLLFLGCLALVVGVFSFLSLRQARELALADHERHASELAATLQSALSSPRIQNVDQILLAWSREVQHVQVRLVNPEDPLNSARRPAVPTNLVVRSTEVITLLYPSRTGQNMMYSYIPLNDTSGTKLEVAAPESFSLDRLGNSLRNSAIALVAVSAATSIVILLGGMWMVGRPLDQLVEKVHRVGQGDLSGPVELHRGDELGKLGEAVNEMCTQLDEQRKRIASETAQRLQAVEQLRHADRLKTVGRLAAGLAHEIGTPLSVVSGRAELIASGKLSSADVQESARTIKTQSQRITTIVQELLNFARRKAPLRERGDLNQLLLETIRLLQPMSDKRAAVITLRPFETETEAGGALAEFDASQMQQVFTNLLVNALQATGEGGKIESSVELVPMAVPPQDVGDTGGEYWRISVRDNGVGIAPEAINNIFEPFFTTKDVGEGTGLGLSIAYGIVHEHGGWLAVQSELGQGSQFDLYLPRNVH